ncbi:hypothetical protein AJ80_03913 [Polytolypa hystricis UAMH7299]|uniref:Uncharacterized protein n=1 Tax=Polytolypa hystricis (strain UAMH7299) TaxID=1447883 RepID=A0A2B7YEF2_POLH7|nr:hypothetical protein AJ80_03913 [Polytolypa hystricis UAMH7299]
MVCSIRKRGFNLFSTTSVEPQLHTYMHLKHGCLFALIVHFLSSLTGAACTRLGHREVKAIKHHHQRQAIQYILRYTVSCANNRNLDYILSIREHIRNGRNAESTSTPEKHLDSITFWRQAYEKSEATQTKLLDKIYELEQRNEALLLKARHENGTSSTTSVPAKRKTKTDFTPPMSVSPQKRAKGASHGKTNAVATGQGTVMSVLGVGFEVSERLTASFMRHFHSLQKLLQKRLDQDSLAVASVEVCKAAETMIRSGVESTSSRKYPTAKNAALKPREPELEEILTVTGRCYPFLLQAIKKLSSSDQAINSKGLVTYHIVQLFRVCLEELHQYALSMAKRSLNREKESRGKRAKTKSTLKAPQGPEALAVGNENVLSSFSHLLASMILSLNTSRRDHHDILEGFLLFFIEHVGKTLGMFVFHELHSNPELRLDSPNLPPLASLPAHREAAASERAAGWECKHLVWILERVMSFVDKHQTSTPEPSQQDVPTTAMVSSQGYSLLEDARHKLQNTLLKAVFGTDDPEFKNSLDFPCEPPDYLRDKPLLPLPPSKKEDASQWFTQEVWRLLGWDVLLTGSGASH